MGALQENYQVVAGKFPKIGMRIKLIWGTQEFTDLVHQLLNDTRDNGREGFPKEVVLALLKMQELHDQVFPSMAEPAYEAKVSAYRLSGFGAL